MENKINKETFNKYFDNNKVVNDFNTGNNLKNFKDSNVSSKKAVKRVPHHEVIFEHTDMTVRPYETRVVCAEISGVVYNDTTIKDVDIRFVLNEAIEKYLQYGHLGKVDENDFVKFINKTFHINVISIGSVELKVTRNLRQEAGKPKKQEEMPQMGMGM